MKNLFFILILCSLFACNTKRSEVDSKEVAEDKNEEKFDTKASEKDAQFVVDNISNLYSEIRLSEVAEQHGLDAEVKKIGGEVKTEYSSLLSGLKKYATQKAISVPVGETEEAKSKLEKLTTEKSFDKAWSSQLRDLNKETIDNFEKGSTSLADSTLKKWINASLPTIRKYHDKIMACNNRLK